MNYCIANEHYKKMSTAFEPVENFYCQSDEPSFSATVNPVSYADDTDTENIFSCNQFDINPNDSSSDESEDDIGDDNLRVELRKWTINYQISHVALTALL